MRCECRHPESDHRSIPPYHCQNGMAEMKPLCECPAFVLTPLPSGGTSEPDEYEGHIEYVVRCRGCEAAVERALAAPWPLPPGRRAAPPEACDVSPDGRCGPACDPEGGVHVYRPAPLPSGGER